MYARKDENQNDIVRALEGAGAAVIDLSMVGKGVPDLLCSYHGELFLLEIKNPETHGKLNKLQLEWRLRWRGRAPATVHTPDEALRAIGAIH